MVHEIPQSISPASKIINSLRKGPLGLVIGLTILIMCIHMIGLEKILLSLRQAKPTFLLGGFFLILCWLLLGALNIRTMLSPLTKVSYTNALRAYSKANMMSLIIPGQVGDIIILKYYNSLCIPLSQGITLFAADKAITLFWYIFFSFYACYLAQFWRLFHLWPQNYITTFYIILSAILTVSLLILTRRIRTLISKRILNWLTLSIAYISKAKKAIFLNFLITLLRTILLGGAFWMSIKAYGPSPSLIQALSFAMAAGLVAYIPISFNGLGTVETALIYLYSTIGIESAPVLSMALTLRFIVIIVVSCCSISLNSLRA